MAGGGWRQLEGNAAGSTITAIYAAGVTIWRSSLRLEAPEERKEETKEYCHQRRQGWHSSIAMVDAAV